MIRFAAKRVALPLPEHKTAGWAPYHLFKGPTPSLAAMSCHVSVLSPGTCPHPPHSHIEEELLIILDGEANIEIASSRNDKMPRVDTLSEGQFSFYPAWQHHTIHNRAAHPVTYLMFKWATHSTGITESLPTGVFDYRSQLVAGDSRAFAPLSILNGQTSWLKRLHCHLTRLRSGAGYAPHIDKYDIAIVMLAGKVETVGRILQPYDVVFCGAGEMHGMRNVSKDMAKYLVFEFERYG